MSLFVGKKSVVRSIWGKSDTILLIFAGASAEFALNKAVDWLFFTGRLPADPIGRLFSTVRYARMIVFSSTQKAHQAIESLRKIHEAVEESRGFSIPDWAYRDVLFMLIHYSIAAFELLEHSLTDDEKDEVYQVFYRVGERMGLTKLPPNYLAWLPVRNAHLLKDLQKSDFTVNLFQQYKKHVGVIRFIFLKEAQKLVIPDRVKELLQYGNVTWLSPAIPLYKISRLLQLDEMIKAILLPNEYRLQINELNVLGENDGE